MRIYFEDMDLLFEPLQQTFLFCPLVKCIAGTLLVLPFTTRVQDTPVYAALLSILAHMETCGLEKTMLTTWIDLSSEVYCFSVLLSL